jgi:hypothetical protein
MGSDSMRLLDLIERLIQGDTDTGSWTTDEDISVKKAGDCLLFDFWGEREVWLLEPPVSLRP